MCVYKMQICVSTQHVNKFLFVSKRIDFDEQLSLLDPELCWYKSILSFQYMDIHKKVILFSVVFFSQNKKELIQIKGSLNLTLTSSRETTEIWEEMKHFFLYVCVWLFEVQFLKCEQEKYRNCQIIASAIRRHDLNGLGMKKKNQCSRIKHEWNAWMNDFLH